MSETFETIRREDMRPGRAHGPDLSPLSKAVMATAESGESVRVQLNGSNWRTVSNNLRKRLKARGLKVHMRTESDGVVVFWAERRE